MEEQREFFFFFFFQVCALLVCQMLDALLTTLIREMQSEGVAGRQEEARLVARRFVRSVARVYVVLNVEMSPVSGKKRL